MKIARRNVLVLVVCTAVITGVIAPLTWAAPAKTTPVELLAGNWKADISDSQSILLLFRKDTVEMKSDAGGQVSSIWTGKFSLSKDKADSQMDWTDLKAGDRAVPDNRCLYRLAGDTLLVIGGGPQDRPTRFYTGPGGEPRTLVFTRVTAETKPGK